MATVQRATIDDLYRTPGKAELIGGRIVPRMANRTQAQSSCGSHFPQPR